MRVTTKRAHPQGKSRSITLNYPRPGGSGKSRSGGDLSVDGPDVVSISAVAEDGEDWSVSSRVHIEFTIDDDPDQIDRLIKLLSELRAVQLRRDGR